MSAADLDRVAQVLAEGLIVAVPTDTVYGLAVDPAQPGAVERLFAAKRRPRGLPLPLLVAGIDQVAVVAEVTDVARDLFAAFWPGPLTVVLDRAPTFDLELGDDRRTVAVRCPDHGFVRALCARLGPLAVTSANRHGEETPATAGEVAAVFGAELGHVVDGGPCRGRPSTVVDCAGGQLSVLREGAIAAAAFAVPG